MCFMQKDLVSGPSLQVEGRQLDIADMSCLALFDPSLQVEGHTGQAMGTVLIILWLCHGHIIPDELSNRLRQSLGLIGLSCEWPPLQRTEMS